jgi:hypothetical protein
VSAAPELTAAPSRETGRLSPYQGLVPFGEEDADWFFGRDDWCDIVRDNLLAYRLTVLYGGSGVGKSSILHAGVVRRLREAARREIEEQRAAGEEATPENVVVAFSTWSGDDPLADLGNAIRDAATDLFPEPVVTPSAERLDNLIGAWSGRLGAQLLIILDQFEEYFLYRPHESSDGSLDDELCRALRRVDLPAHFLISIREDALAKLDRLERRVPTLLDHLLRVERLDRGAACEAIELPIPRWNELENASSGELEVEPELVEAVLEEVEAGRVVVGASANESPLGSAAPGESGIEAPYLQLVMMRLWDEERSAGSRALRLSTFRALGGAQSIVGSHLDTALAELSPSQRDVAGLVLRHLVTPSGTKIALSSSDLATYAELDEARVAPVLHELGGGPRILKPTAESRYEIYHDALAAPILDWQSRWQEGVRRRRRRRRLLALAVASLVAVALALLLGWLYFHGSAATKRAKEAEKSAAIGQGIDMWVSPDGTRMLTGGALFSLPTATSITNLGSFGSVPARAAFSPDGTLLATYDSGENFVRLWDATTVAEPSRINGPHGVQNLAISADKTRLVTVGLTQGLRIYDLATRRRIQTTGDTDVEHAAFSPDGEHIVGVTYNYDLRIWDADTGKQVSRKALRSSN